jgi:hypothetical protein
MSSNLKIFLISGFVFFFLTAAALGQNKIEEKENNSVHVVVYGHFTMMPRYEFIVFESGEFVFTGKDWISLPGTHLVRIPRNGISEIFNEIEKIQSKFDTLMKKDTMGIFSSDPFAGMYINRNNNISFIRETGHIFDKFFELIEKYARLNEKYVWSKENDDKGSINHYFTIFNSGKEKFARRNPNEIDRVLLHGLKIKDCLDFNEKKNETVSFSITPKGEVTLISFDDNSGLSLKKKDCLKKQIQKLEFRKIDRRESNLRIRVFLKDLH